MQSLTVHLASRAKCVSDSLDDQLRKPAGRLQPIGLKPIEGALRHHDAFSFPASLQQCAGKRSIAKVAELVDAPDLGSDAARRGGSSPPFAPMQCGRECSGRCMIRKTGCPDLSDAVVRIPLAAAAVIGETTRLGGFLAIRQPASSISCRRLCCRWQESTCKHRSNPPAIWNAA